jgi:type VI secretion system protein ImpM
LAGLYGKVPAHGDFVRRGMPSSFVGPWDTWLAAGIATAREQLGAQWEAAWDSAPAWRFALPPGACGPDAVAGVMLPSHDQVGRRFPITLAALLPPDAAAPEADWFDALEAAALAGLSGRADADALAAALPLPGAPILVQPFALPPILPAAPPQHDDAPAPWPASDAPPPPSAAFDADHDVLSLLAEPGAPSTVADAAPSAHHDADALALLIGASGPTPGPAEAIDTDGTLAGLIGAGATSAPPEFADAPSHPLPPTHGDDGTLAGLIGASAESDPPPLPPQDATLSDLLGAPASPTTEADDVLAGLIGPEPAAPLPLSAGEGTPDDAHGPDLLPESVPMDWPDLAHAATTATPVHDVSTAPPAPEGGGWWTRGGAHVPPMVWPLAGLPDPADFAYLLEAAA